LIEENEANAKSNASLVSSFFIPPAQRQIIVLNSENPHGTDVRGKLSALRAARALAASAVAAGSEPA